MKFDVSTVGSRGVGLNQKPRSRMACLSCFSARACGGSYSSELAVMVGVVSLLQS